MCVAFFSLSQCCACNFLSARNHKNEDSWHIYLKSTIVRKQMSKSVLALSHILLSVELLIQKAEKTILESMLGTEMLTLSRRLHFL